MTDRAQFTVEDTSGFYVTVAEDITVYEAYNDAVADIQQHLQTDADGFLAEVSIDGDSGTDDIAVTLEQVSWQQIIRDLPESTAARADDTAPAHAEDQPATATSVETKTDTTMGEIGDGED